MFLIEQCCHTLHTSIPRTRFSIDKNIWYTEDTSKDKLYENMFNVHKCLPVKWKKQQMDWKLFKPNNFIGSSALLYYNHDSCDLCCALQAHNVGHMPHCTGENLNPLTYLLWHSDWQYCHGQKILIWQNVICTSFPTNPYVTTGESNIGVKTVSSNVQCTAQVMHINSAIILNNNNNSSYTIILYGCPLQAAW